MSKTKQKKPQYGMDRKAVKFLNSIVPELGDEVQKRVKRPLHENMKASAWIAHSFYWNDQPEVAIFWAQTHQLIWEIEQSIKD